jgi:hypothetical protein
MAARGEREEGVVLRVKIGRAPNGAHGNEEEVLRGEAAEKA